MVRVLSSTGECVGVGYANPRCTIAVRILSHADEAIDAGFLRRRIESALSLRRALLRGDTTAFRLINGEGDRLPGVVVDHYSGVLVLQLLTAGADRLRPLLAEALQETLRPRGIYERSGGAVRTAEGLRARAGVLHGEVPEQIRIEELGLAFTVRPAAGQKTGFFLDQRDNRARVRQLACGRRVLDAFAYSGAFGVAAAAGGAARVVLVDTSADALAVAAENWRLNRLPEGVVDIVRADVGRYLRDTGERFDLIILDPPALARQRKDVPRAARAYKDLHLWALRRADSQALIATFSCSQHVGAGLFRKIVVGAAGEAGRAVQLLQHLGPGIDHPTALGHPEGEYLHGLLLRAE